MSSVSGSEVTESESDIEMQSALPALAKKTAKKTPKSPSEELLKKNQDPKKMTTKDMIKEVLSEQKSRKGISLYAIRKFIIEKHTVNVDRITTLIKKSLKSGIEEGSIVQTKGIGASGSFKLAPKKKPDASEKPKKKKPKTSDKTDKAKKTKKDVEKKEIVEKKGTKKKVELKTKAARKEMPEKKELQKKKVELKEKKEKTKMAKEKQTPAKKRAAMMKRKSIGSIIKPPKMKPKKT